MKIDVQGMKLHALIGMAGILRRHKPKLAIELHKGVNRADVLTFLVEIGYSRRGLPIEPTAGRIGPARRGDHRRYAFSPDSPKEVILADRPVVAG